MAAWPGCMHRNTSCLADPPRAPHVYLHVQVACTSAPHASLDTHNARSLPPRPEHILIKTPRASRSIRPISSFPDVQNISTEVHLFDRVGQTDRAMYRIDPRRANSDSDRSFSLLGRLAHTACTGDRSDDLASLFDPMLDISFGYFSKNTSRFLGVVSSKLTPLSRWTCASYQATDPVCSFIGPSDPFLGSFTIHVRDLALAGVEGGTSKVGEAPLSPLAEGTTLPVRGAGMVDADGDFDAVLAGLNSECVLPSCSGEPEGQDPVAEDAGGSVALNPREVIGEGEALRAKDD
ncbi:hypothetical protein DY000_02040711 [Brassica cretica]|uniref:Xylanase inhibitor N-terminal domain-containing protein n=1 Tax=Brassica cretica TaxID=69181 RepID=A0ABQ7BCN5_BRACR|nr:hypothetical protein DY000_02040711 [Brassica cretica]